MRSTRSHRPSLDFRRLRVAADQEQSSLCTNVNPEESKPETTITELSTPLSPFPNTLLQKKSVPSRFSSGQSGVALIEFVIVFPVLALLIAGTAVLGIFMLQAQVVNDGTRSAARVAASMSNSVATCKDLKKIAEREAGRFVYEFSQQTSLGDIQNRWAAPAATVVNSTWDGYQFQTIEVQAMSSQNANCTFCMNGFLSPTAVPAKSTFMLERPCA